MSLPLFCVIVLIVIAHAREGDTSDTAGNEDPVTVTPLGRIRGSWMETRSGRSFQAYRGIRYAQPPVGELRFKAPRPIAQYQGTVDASSEGPGCPQPTLTPDFVVDEDCLRLNVYTPGVKRNSSHLLPVIVFIHPGGFYSVSGRTDTAGPHYLLERDVVLVTINYRLGTLGYLSTGDEHAPGNYGFKDQVQALRWVQANVRSFGGDPDLVTVAGYSAGSFSIGLHMVSPMAKGLFHRAISMSSSPISQVVIGSDQRYLAVRQAKLLDCPTSGNREMVDCMRGKPWHVFSDTLDQMFEFGYDPILLWSVVLEPDLGEERFLTEQPLEVIRSGRAYTVPYIESQTKDEFFWKAYSIQRNATLFSTMNAEWDRVAPISFMLPAEGAVEASHRLRQAYFGFDHDFANNTKDMDALGKLFYSDSIIGFAVHRMANLMCRHSRHPVFYYEFAYKGNHSYYEDRTTGKPTGVAHHDDLIYLFTIPASFPAIEVGTPDDVIVNRMTAIWYNFARYGDPNHQPDTPELRDMSWPTMKPDNRTYLKIAAQFSVEKNLFEKGRYNVWDELYHIEY